jgi:signal peptidase II
MSRAAAASPLRRLLAYRWLLLLAALVFLLDLLTKAWIAGRLPYGTGPDEPGAIPVIDGFLSIVHVGNTGAAWSLFRGASVFLAILAGATLAAICIWRRALGLQEPGAQVGFGLLCGGIAGNLLDRLRFGHVIDFIDLKFGSSYHYPTFNVADAGICVGVILYLWHSLRSARDER